MNALDRGSQLIAIKPMKFSGRNYLPGDKFDYRRVTMGQRRTVSKLLSGTSMKLAELTAENMASALRFRPEGSIKPRGFTIAGLLAMGYLTQQQVDERGWGATDEGDDEGDGGETSAPWEAPEGSIRVFAKGKDEETAGEGDILWIVPFKTGGAPRYFIHDAAGEQISGAASINGKANAEKAANEIFAKREEERARQRQGDPDWSVFPENPDEWTDQQVDEFDAFYEAMQPGSEPMTDHPAVVKLIEERRAAEADQGGADQQPSEDGLTDAERAELFEAMTDDELRAHVAHVAKKDASDYADMTRQALLELATENQKPGETNGGDVQPSADDAQG